MKKLISCEYNFDNCCVELKFTDGSIIAIDTIAVENEIADNMYQRSELDYLIYNDPLVYADLILNGEPEAYLKAVTAVHTAAAQQRFPGSIDDSIHRHGCDVVSYNFKRHMKSPLYDSKAIII